MRFGPGLAIVGSLSLTVGVGAGCKTAEERQMEENHRRAVEDQAACKDELEKGTTPVSERCQPLARARRDQKETENCDKAAKAQRESWLSTVTTLDGYTTSPEREGFTIGGGCGQVLQHNAIDCADNAIITVFRDDPDLVDAMRLGFLRLLCREVDHLEQDGAVVFRREVEKSMAWVVGDAQRKPPGRTKTRKTR